MSQVSVTYHFVFSTYGREQVLIERHERELYKFIYNLSQARGVKVWRIGGMPDHVHILCDVPPKMAVADYIKLIKAESSKFLNMNPHFPGWKRWTEGYAVFSVDASTRQTRIDYIRNQKQHHKSLSYQDEYNNIMVEYGLNPDIE